MATNDTFNLYFSTRPTAVLPLGPSDLVMLYQNGGVTIAPFLSVIGVTPKLSDASGGPRTELLPASGIVAYIKDDNSANAVTIQPSVLGQTVMRGDSISLTVQDEHIFLQLIGTNWYRIG